MLTFIVIIIGFIFIGYLLTAIDSVNKVSSGLQIQLKELDNKLGKVLLALKKHGDIKKELDIKISALKPRLVERLLRRGKTKKEAISEADKILSLSGLLGVEEKELPYMDIEDANIGLERVLRWVHEDEDDEILEKKYGNLVTKAEQRIQELAKKWRSGTVIDEKDFQDWVGVDWEGLRWLMQRLKAKGLVRKYDDDKSWRLE